MQKEMSIPARAKESLNSEVKAERLLKTDIQSQRNITVTTNAEDVLIEINATNLKTATERLR